MRSLAHCIHAQDGCFVESRSFASFQSTYKLVGIKSLQQWWIYTSLDVRLPYRGKPAVLHDVVGVLYLEPPTSSAQNFYNNVEVKQVDVSSTTGTFGILPNHVPAISVLKPGLVVVYEQDDKQNKFFGMLNYSMFHIMVHLCFLLSHIASSGTVTINADSTVQILVEDAYPLDMLDAQVFNHLLLHSKDCGSYSSP